MSPIGSISQFGSQLSESSRKTRQPSPATATANLRPKISDKLKTLQWYFLMATISSYRQLVLDSLGDRIETIHSFGVSSLALFGSVARDEATETSDLDFLVEFEGSVTFDRYMDLKFFLEDLFNKPVDLVTKKSLKFQITETVLAEAIDVT
jgi:uncharacterized protein